MRIFHWQCRHGPIGHPDSEPPDSELRSILLPESLCDATTDLRVQDFLRMTAEEYTREILFLGLDVDDPKRPDRKEWFSTMLDFVERGSHFGATFSSLQAGLAIDLTRLSMGDPSPSPSSIPVATSSALGTSGQPVSARAEPLNRFEFRNGRLFHLEFHADGRHEEDDILRKECVGLAYYELLLRNPGRDLESEHLYNFVKSKQKPEQFLHFSKQDVELIIAISNKDDSTTNRSPRYKGEPNGKIDQQTRIESLDRLKAIKLEKKKARDEGELGELRELEKEEQQIKTWLGQATYKGRIKDLGREHQAYVENTRKALQNALARIRRTMPGLANYLGRYVTPKLGRWTYNPPANVVFHFSDK